MEERGRGAIEGEPALEEQDRQGATHPLAASRSHISSREGRVRLRVGRGPRDRHIVRLLYSSEEGVDASDHLLVCHWLDGPRGKQFDAVIAVGDNVVLGAHHW